MQLVPVITIEEVEIALVSMQIAWKRAECESLLETIMPLERASLAFERRVTKHTGALASERDYLRQVCEELQEYTARLHARTLSDPDGELDTLFSPEELDAIAQLANPKLPITKYERIERSKAEHTYHHYERIMLDKPAARVLPATDVMRTLYRQLARAYHPDLSLDVQERRFRQEMMLRINDAWHQRDLAALQALSQRMIPERGGSVASLRLAWLRQELDQTETESRQLTQQLQRLNTAKTRHLWHNGARASATIAKRISMLKAEIEELQQQRQSALDELRIALGMYVATR